MKNSAIAARIVGMSICYRSASTVDGTAASERKVVASRTFGGGLFEVCTEPPGP
jgi:hypothetical protein